MPSLIYDSNYDYTYDDLDFLTGYLKSVAIDAYIVSKYSDGSNELTITDEYYLIAFRSDTGQGGRVIQISCPDIEGNGGGEVLSDSAPPPFHEDDCVAEFAKVRKRINDIIGPWLTLPDPVRIEREIDKWLDVSHGISSPTRIINAKMYGGANVDASIRQIGTWIGTMNGEVVGKVSSFTSKLQGVVDSLCGEFLLWGGTLSSEKAMFAETRRSVVKAVKQAIDMFEAVALNNSAEMDISFKVVSAAIEGLLLFVSPEHAATKKVLGTAGVTVKGIDSLTDEKPEKGNADDYESVIDRFEKAFVKIGLNVSKSEEGVERVLFGNLGIMARSKSVYDIEMDPMDSTNVDTDRGRSHELNVNNVTAANVAQTMCEVCSSLRNAVKKIPAVSMYSCLAREKEIGIGEFGPSRAFDQFQFRLSKLIQNLADDLENEAKNFQLAVAAITEQDAQSKSQLEQTVDDIKQDPGDPWVVRGTDKPFRPAKGNQIV